MLSHRVHNRLHALVLLTALLALLWLLGWLFAGIFGIIWASLLGIIPLFLSIRVFPAVVLKMYGARPLLPREAPRLFTLVEELSSRAGLPVPPRLFYIASNAVLIFSVGLGKEGAIAVTDGILRFFTARELVGVLAHEIGHIRHNDTWVMSFADVVSRITSAVSLLGQFLLVINLPLLFLSDHSLPWLPLLLMVAAPVISALLQLALSRNREFDADLYAARLFGDPSGLASALVKLEDLQQKIMRKLVSPGHRGTGPSLLRTHPRTEERVRRLLQLEREQALQTQPSVENGETVLSSQLPKPARKPRRHLSGLWH